MFTKEQTAQLATPGQVAQLVTQVSNLEKQVEAQRKAFDAFFDVVVKELGYQSETREWFGGLGCPPVIYKVSPRQLAVTRPEPELIRTKKRGE